MYLTELEPKFLKIVDATSHRTDATFEDNDGIFFLCPMCFKLNDGRIGTHGVICWKPSVPLEKLPGPGRWNQTGTGVHDLSLSPSIQLIGGCNWHGFITNGEAVL